MTNGSGITLADYWKHHFDIVGGLQHIKITWDSASQRNLNTSWRNLWLDCVDSPEASTQEPAVVKELISLGWTMGLEVSKEDVSELVKRHTLKISIEDLVGLQQEEQKGLQHGTLEEHEKEPREVLLAVSGGLTICGESCRPW
ncbi:hypothetical protein JRQ81_016028 [Phrynocephalus forsythii]|uniref:Uncharacterized protein n=1 Tax=Phrynocephalus forsythii TaxID=171643 RepID=A0A9Q1B2N7_9SAUR|nr:hypothetical protein JRQ81_016028 [Phrynocephalus forsythii]